MMLRSTYPIRSYEQLEHVLLNWGQFGKPDGE
jgi:hypothetical protein